MGSLSVIHDSEIRGNSARIIKCSEPELFEDDMGSKSTNLMEVCAPTCSIFKKNTLFL
ncbi:hypothetical protein Hanom_Chr02g00177861 [Helianthus anomalus]